MPPLTLTPGTRLGPYEIVALLGVAVRPRPMVTLGDYPYDVSADGQRFLVNTLVEETASAAITLVVNWTAGLKK